MDVPQANRRIAMPDYFYDRAQLESACWTLFCSARCVAFQVADQSASDLLEQREAITVFGVVPAFEIGFALFGEGGARFHQVALGAMLMQEGSEALLVGSRSRPHLAHHMHGVDA